MCNEIFDTESLDPKVPTFENEELQKIYDLATNGETSNFLLAMSNVFRIIEESNSSVGLQELEDLFAGLLIDRWFFESFLAYNVCKHFQNLNDYLFKTARGSAIMYPLGSFNEIVQDYVIKNGVSFELCPYFGDFFRYFCYESHCERDSGRHHHPDKDVKYLEVNFYVKYRGVEIHFHSIYSKYLISVIHNVKIPNVSNGVFRRQGLY